MPDNKKPEEVRPNQNPASTPNANPGPATATGSNRAQPATDNQGPSTRQSQQRNLAWDAQQAENDPSPASQTPRNLDDGWQANWNHDDLENQEAVPDNRDPNSPEMQSLQRTAERNRNQAEAEDADAPTVALHLRTSGQIIRPAIRNLQLINGFVVLELDETHSVAFPSSEVSRIDMENSRY